MAVAEKRKNLRNYRRRQPGISGSEKKPWNWQEQLPIMWKNLILGAGENSELGMMCGGRVKVLFYSVCAQDPGVGEFLKDALAAADEGKPYWLVLPFSEGTPRIRREITEGRGHCRILEEDGQKLYAEEFCYDGRVYIFGGGHLAQELVPVLSHLGFWCMVLDDREEYTDHALFPGVQETKTVDLQHFRRFWK